MITNQTLSKSGNERGSANLQRRTLIGGALAALLASSRRVIADEDDRQPNDPFILLLHRIYEPVTHAPNLDLSSVDLDDGTYSRTTIYPIYEIHGSKDQDRAIGKFFVQFNGNLCAYELPGGAIAMQFLNAPAGAPPGFNGFVPFPDGAGGVYLEGTFELTILEATGIYQPFACGHNHMVDRLHKLANGSLDEFCFCNISQYQFP